MLVPVIEKVFGEETGQDVEVAHGEDVDVDNMGQRVDNCQEKRNGGELTHTRAMSFVPPLRRPDRTMAVTATKRWKSMAASKGT